MFLIGWCERRRIDLSGCFDREVKSVFLWDEMIRLVQSKMCFAMGLYLFFSEASLYKGLKLLNDQAVLERVIEIAKEAHSSEDIFFSIEKTCPVDYFY